MATILLVDDHPDVREVVGQMLELHGHQVSTAESGENAWEQMQQSPPDAVVVDQRLPGMTGMDLLHRMRQTPALSKVAVVLCSGDDTERDAARSAGAWDFWLKGSDAMFDAVARLGERLKVQLAK
jgi:two-component system alkaline phosphatase synthesis response regulator PhoP